jgi:hypothetical protein
MDEPHQPAFILKASQRLQVLLDKSTPLIAPRWAALVGVLIMYIGAVEFAHIMIRFVYCMALILFSLHQFESGS